MAFTGTFFSPNYTLPAHQTADKRSEQLAGETSAAKHSELVDT